MRPFGHRLLLGAGLVLLLTAPLNALLGDGVGIDASWKALVGVGALLLGRWMRPLGTRASWTTKRRRAAATSLVAVTAVGGLLTAANILAVRHPTTWDVTRDRFNSLSPASLATLAELHDTVEVTALLGASDPRRAEVERLLSAYRAASPWVEVSLIDPERQPEVATRLRVRPSITRLVVARGARQARSFEVDEQEVTAGIVRVATDDPPRVVMLLGHGERDLESEGPAGWRIVGAALEEAGYSTETRSWVDASGASGDWLSPAVAALIIAGPQSALHATEVAKVRAYFEAGGRVLLALDPGTGQELAPWLAALGVTLTPEVIADANSQSLGLGWSAPVVHAATDEHPVTRNLGAPVLLQLGRPFKLAQGSEAHPLLVTGMTAWADPFPITGEPRQDLADPSGRLVVAAAISTEPNEAGDGEGRLAIIGDSDFATNRLAGQFGNTEFLGHLVAWLVERTPALELKPRRRAAARLNLDVHDLGVIKTLSLDVVPLCVILAGVVFVVRRRAR